MPSALVIGGASCVLEDAEKALRLFEPDAFFVINDMIPLWERRCDYALTLHPEKMPAWINRRRINGHPEPGEIWSHRRATSVIQRATEDWAGSSGLFAVKLAMEQGFEKIVLAGVPMSADANHVVRGEPWTSAVQFRNAWNKRYQEIKPFARSMSGWTRQLLGQPTTEWLEENIAA